MQLDTKNNYVRLIFLILQERVGQNIRDGIIKAGPAVAVVGQAAAIAKG